MDIRVNRRTKLCVTPKDGNVCIPRVTSSLSLCVSFHAVSYLVRQYYYVCIAVTTARYIVDGRADYVIKLLTFVTPELEI